jgi:hypothetical protein
VSWGFNSVSEDRRHEIARTRAGAWRRGHSARVLRRIHVEQRAIRSYVHLLYSAAEQSSWRQPPEAPRRITWPRPIGRPQLGHVIESSLARKSLSSASIAADSDFRSAAYCDWLVVGVRLFMPPNGSFTLLHPLLRTPGIICPIRPLELRHSSSAPFEVQTSKASDTSSPPSFEHSAEDWTDWT